MPQSNPSGNFAHAAMRIFAASEHESLRVIAHAAARAGAAEAAALARSYADLCKKTFAPPFPLLWPRRTAGAALRVVVLLPVEANEQMRSATRALLALPRELFDLLLATVGRKSPAVVAALGDAAANIAELPPSPDMTVAKAVAARDPDVLIDMNGLAAAAGPLLAVRPARALWSLGHPAAHLPPLVDRAVADAEALLAALRTLTATVRNAPECPVSAAELANTWAEGVRAQQQGEHLRARNAYAQVLALQPEFAPAHYLWGILARDAGDVGGAGRAFAAAVSAAPDYVDARLAAARLATQQGDADTAVALCEGGLALAPRNVLILRALGLAHLARGDGGAAAMAFERALAEDPIHADTLYNLGVALQKRRSLSDAVRAYRQALAIQPDLIAALFNLGVANQENGSDDAAIAAYEAVLRTDALHVAAYANLGAVLFASGRFEAWRENFRRFEATCPRALPLAVQALEVAQFDGDFRKVDRYLQGLATNQFVATDDVELVDCLEQLNYLLLFFDVRPDTILDFARAYDAAAKRVYGEPLPRTPRRRPGRLRIGYLSADLRDHVMGKMMWQAVQHHDRSRFEISFYSLVHDADEWTERFRGAGDRFEVIADLSERVAALRIAQDDLDILVDLSTHTKGARPGILAFKPARVQITHVACAGSVGLSAVDFKLTDHYADVAANQSFHLDTLLPMEGCVYPFRYVAPASSYPFSRTGLGIAPATIVIGAFISALKLSQRCLGLWRAVLERIPQAKLAFSPFSPAMQKSYVQIAAAAGIAADRILFVPQGRNEAENQSRYALVDFVLDPMPYGGVNGTLEALAMAVPVVTLVGQRHAERTGYSMLVNLGVTDTIANNESEYVSVAARLATDSAFIGRVRTAIRAGLANSALTDMSRHTRSLEAAYETALSLRCSPAPPKPLPSAPQTPGTQAP